MRTKNFSGARILILTAVYLLSTATISCSQGTLRDARKLMDKGQYPPCRPQCFRLWSKRTIRMLTLGTGGACLPGQTGAAGRPEVPEGGRTETQIRRVYRPALLAGG